MKADEDNWLCRKTGVFVPLLVCVVLGVCFWATQSDARENSAEVTDFAAFQQALEASDDARAASIGDAILRRLEKKYRADAGFMTYKSKLGTAEFLARNMASQLQNAAGRGGRRLADQLFAGNNQQDKQKLDSIAPAKTIYETSSKLFLAPISITQLPQQERDFLAAYYDLKLRTFISALATAGQVLVITEPAFKATHDYVLVLPLLHASENRPISVEVLPHWMQQPEQLDVLSDSCLLHFGLPFDAMTLAGKAAQMQEKQFSELDFYKSAAKKCGVSKAHTAVASLNKAIDCAGPDDPGTTVDLQFEIVQLWLDSENYSLAAGRARNIFETYPDCEQVCKAVWLYHYALSRANKTDEILAHVDQALADKRCRNYEVKLMYTKWWALRRDRDQAAAIAALEYELLNRYGDEPMVAPIVLSQATDMLARQDYNGARAMLADLVQKFPSTNAAEQAKKMLEKLKPSGKAE
jgi:hypothetical protein